MLLLLSFSLWSSAQGYRVIYDAAHLNAVNENGTVRLASEQSHLNLLKGIRSRVEEINLNLASVTLVQQMIYTSLTEADQALKSGRSVQHIFRLVVEIGQLSSKMLASASGNPALLLFAEEAGGQLKDRGLNLAGEVSAFILSENGELLMDFEKRDALLRSIILELKVIRALLFSMERAMHWARINGVLRSLNPYKEFINRDKRMAEEIIQQNYLLTK